MWPRIQTAFAVVVLTCFIWIFAERQVTRSAEIPLDIGLDEQLGQSHPEILVEFLDEDGQAVQRLRLQVTISGATGRIQDLLDGRLAAQAPVVTLESLGIADSLPEQTQVYEITAVRDLFQERLSLRERDTFLQVTQVEPERLRVRVTPLERRVIPVRVYDWGDLAISKAEVNPARVESWVIPGQTAEARVRLNLDQKAQASEGFIPVDAVVRVRHREQSYQVQVRLQQSETATMSTVSLPRLGVIMPSEMTSLYQVLIESDPEVQAPIHFRGSSLAMSDYQNGRYHLLLEIDPADMERVGQPIDRTLKYALPDAGEPFEIIDRSQKLVRFRLEPVGPAERPTAQP